MDTSEFVTLTYLTPGDKPTNGATEEMLGKLNSILKKTVNAELQVRYIPWDDYLKDYNEALAKANGDIDLIGTSSDWLDAWPNAKAGNFLELSEDMLKKYAPKTYASVSADHWDLCKYDGKIYIMPEDNYEQWTNHGYAYRLDIAKEAGLDEVMSWEDLTTYFEYVKKAYPDMIPWDSDGSNYEAMASGWIVSHSDFVAIDGLSSGAIWGGKKGDLYTVYSPYMTETDSLIEYAKLMMKWNDMGVWKDTVLNNGDIDNRQEYRDGLVAAEEHHTQTWTDLCSHKLGYKIYENDDDAETGFFYFGKETGNVVAPSITHGAMAISSSSKHPKRALMVYDLLRNYPECYNLVVYGVKGRQWDVNEAGLRVLPEKYVKEKDAITFNYWWGRNDDIEILDAEVNWDAVRLLYKEYDAIKIDYPYGQFVADVSKIDRQISDIAEIHKKYMRMISYGKYTGSAEDIVANYQQALIDAGINEVTAELQRQFDEIYK